MESDTKASADYSAEAAADLLRSQGRHVIRTESCWWYNVYGQKNIYYSFPPHRLVTPTKAELREIFKQAPKAKALRYLSPSTSAGSDSYLWICRKPYDLDKIEAKARNQVRQGLRNCQIEPISLGMLQTLGDKANSDSMKRFGIEPKSLKFGKEMLEAHLYEAWGAFVDGNLASYIVTLRIEDWVFIQIHRSVNEYLGSRPNNALIFSVMQELLSRPEVSTVSYGWEPLIPLDSLDKFKLAMGSSKFCCKQSIVLAPWLKRAFPPVICRLIEKLSDLRKSNRRLRQIAGACRVIRESHA